MASEGAGHTPAQATPLAQPVFVPTRPAAKSEEEMVPNEDAKMADKQADGSGNNPRFDMMEAQVELSASHAQLTITAIDWRRWSAGRQ